MENCLKTQLKSIVSNDALVKIGELYYENTGTSNMTVRFDINGYTPVNGRLVKGTVTNTVGGVSVNLNIGDNSINTEGMFNLTITPGSAIFIDNKYLTNITRIDEKKVIGDIEDLKYMDGYSSFYTSRSGDAAFLKTHALSIFEISGHLTNLEEGLSGSTASLTRLSSQNTNNIISSIEYWINFTSLNRFGYWGNTNMLIGTLEELINGWIGKGRTSGTLVLEYPNSLLYLTYDNGTGRKSISELYPTDDTIYVVWDAQGHITITTA